MDHARQLQIVDEPALAAHQPALVGPRHHLADIAVRPPEHARIGAEHVAHGFLSLEAFGQRMTRLHPQQVPWRTATAAGPSDTRRPCRCGGYERDKRYLVGGTHSHW